MSVPLSGLARAEMASLPLYAPDVADCAVDVSDNTNLWGMPPAARAAMAAMDPASLSRYPSLYGAPLREAILSYAGLARVEGLNVVTGCGSDDVLDATMRAFARPGARIAFSSPTFSMIPTFARLNGIEPVAIPFTDAFDVDIERLLGCDAEITYLCTPNNPTATALSRAAVEQVVERARGIVVIDEAYAEFAPETFMDLVSRSPKLIVARTFSKAFGMAGLRVGYGVAQSELADLVARARGPYKVNAVAERAALAALQDEAGALGWVRTHAQLAIEVRGRLSAELSRIGLVPFPSAANFVCVPTPHGVLLARKLRERGVLVRALSGLPRDLAPLATSGGQALRVGVGPWETMQRVIDTLEDVL